MRHIGSSAKNSQRELVGWEVEVLDKGHPKDLDVEVKRPLRLLDADHLHMCRTSERSL